MKKAVYQIKVEGHLDPGRADWFDGWDLILDGDGHTLLTGSSIDQPKLHGLLAKIRDLNLTLISLYRLDPGFSEGRNNENGGTYERASR